MNLRLSITHKQIVADEIVEFRLDILDRDWLGAPTEMSAVDGFFTWTYDEMNEENPFQNPIQGSEVRTSVLFQEDQESQFTIVDDIRLSDEDRFETHLYINNVHKWTGKLNMRLLEYEERSFPLSVDISAKDTAGTKAKFPLSTANDNQPYITILAECLQATGLDLPISTYTSLTHFEVDNDKDFLREFYTQRYHFRKYATGGEGPGKMTYKEVAEHICRRYNLIIRQAANRWHIFELPGVAKGGVLQSNYNSSGVFQSSEEYTKSVTVDNESSYIRDSSRNRVRSPLKRINSSYNHKTLISAFDFESEYVHEVESDRSSEETDIENDTSLNFDLTGDVHVTISGSVNTPQSGRYAVLEIVGVREGTTDILYDSSNQSWGVIGEVRVPINATSGSALTGVLNLSGLSIPNDVDSLKVNFAWAVVPGETVTKVQWKDFSGKLVSGDAIADSASIDYVYEREGNYTLEDDMSPVILGQGPTSYSRGAVRKQLLGQWPILRTGFRVRGEEETDQSLEKVVLRERMSLSRTGSRNMLAQMWLNFDADHFIEYDGSSWFFLGGTLTGRTGWWNGPLLDLSTDLPAAGDIFDTIILSDPAASTNRTSVSILNDVLRSNNYNESQEITSLTSAISGTVTSIPISSIGSNVLNVGDPFSVFNLRGASLTEFVLAEPQLPDATTLQVEPRTLSETIVSGSWVLFTGERVANYITRSDTGMRLGVRSYDQATLDGEAWATDDGEDFVFVGEGDSVGKFRFTESEIAILQGEIIVKVRADGRLAFVRLDAKAEGGSLVEIQADNINLQGLVTAINQGGSQTEIDGGKIKADTSVIVGSGNNVAGLTGAHPNTRIYAGNADPDAAPFRVLQDGSVFGNKFVQLSGEDVDGVITNFSIKNLTVTGKLSNEEDDYIIDQTGIRVDSVDVALASPERSFSVFSDGVRLGSFFGIDSQSDKTLRINSNSDVDISVQVTTANNNIRMQGGTLIVPRVTNTTIGFRSPEDGSIVYNTSDNEFLGYQNGGWVRFATTS